MARKLEIVSQSATTNIHFAKLSRILNSVIVTKSPAQMLAQNPNILGDLVPLLATRLTVQIIV